MVETQRKNLQAKYGTQYTNYGQLQQVKEKIKETTYKHYGVTSYLATKEAHQKYKEKTGYDNPMQNPEIQEKTKQTCIKKYGNKSYLGSDNYLNNICEIQEKIKNTNHEKYGTDWYCQSEEYRKHVPEMKEKEYKTRLLNNNYKKSTEEDTCYDLLKEKYPDIVRQYRSELYPFNCDFYIPSKNLYIEYNGSHFHNNHPFNKNDKNDIKELNRLKLLAETSERHKIGKQSQYDNMIYTWTDLDVRKRNIANENNLNYIMFYTIDACKEWLENN